MHNTLSNLLEVTHDTPECVILQPRKHAQDIDFILTNMFDLKPDMIRVTKGEDHVITIWNDGKSFSYTAGAHGHTLVSDRLWALRRLLMSTLIRDYGICME